MKKNSKEFLTNYNNCIFCNSKKKKKKKERKLRNNFYLEAIRNDLNLNKKFMSQMKLYECQNCGTVQNNPWFKKEISHKIYSNIYGQHNRSWSNIINFFRKSVFPEHGNLFSILKKNIRIKNYAEFNGAFMGLFLNFFDQEYKTTRRNKFSFFTKCLEYLSSRQLAGKSKYFLKKDKTKSVKLNKEIRLLSKFFIKNKINKKLFTDNSSLGWSQNDNYKSVNSKSLLSELMDIDIINFNSYKKKLNFDLFGIFHTLDHTFEPKKIFNFAIRNSKYTIVYCHIDENLEKQHLFTLTKNFLKYLKKRKIYYIDLTEKIKKNYKTKELYFICSTNKKLINKFKI